MKQQAPAMISPGHAQVTSIGDGAPEAPCLVSVVIPVFNGEQSIAAAIESVLGQTEQRFEVLVIDDCSTDDTVGIVERMAERDRRVRLLKLPCNRGPGAARNAGMDVARGTWIAPLDADDLFMPTRLELLLSLAKAQKADMVADNLEIRAVGTTPYRLIPQGAASRPRQLTAAEFVLGNIGNPGHCHAAFGFMQAMIRREFQVEHALRYDERNRFGEDYILYLACLRAGACWWITPEPLYVYLVQRDSLTGVQSSADLQRVAEADTAFLRDPRHAGDFLLGIALRQHRAIVDRRHTYRDFSLTMKRQDFRQCLQIALRSRLSAVHILLEFLNRMPRMVLKACRGGYQSTGQMR